MQIFPNAIQPSSAAQPTHSLTWAFELLKISVGASAMLES
jgi:hypothetical protein